MKDFWAEGLQDQRKEKIKKLAVFITFIAIIIAILVLIVIYIYNLNFRRWCDETILGKEILQEDTKYIDLDGDENTKIYAYDKYICIFRKKTLEVYNKVGTKVQEIELDINKPVFTSEGRYMVICEEEGQKFYLISGKEKLFENEVEGKINQINVSKSGYVSAVMTNSSYKSIVDVYDKNGEQIFKTKLVTSRVADVCISQDNKYLAIAEIDISGILIKSSIQIISMELAQTNPAEAMIYKYDAPTDKLLLNIEYQEKEQLICMYSDSIEVLENKESKEIINFVNNKIAFMTIEIYNKVATLQEISTGNYTSDTYVDLINPKTTKKKQYIANDVAKSIETNENKIAINFGTELHIINTNGILLKKYISEKEINDIFLTDSLAAIIYRDKIQIINL